MPVFRQQNRNVHYELYGREGDPVLTICNGLSMRTSHWAPYFEQLPKLGIRVLAYDMLGQGLSAKPILGVDFDDHARTLHALHEHVGVQDPYVLGISFGGVVVLRYALMYPERIKGLIPISTFSELDPQLQGHAYNLYTGLARVGFEFYLDLLMPLNFTNPWLEQNQETLRVIKRVGSSSNELYGIQNLMESLKSFDSLTPELHKIRCPTLVLNGEYDTLTPRHLHDIMRREIPRSQMVIVPHMCHAFTLEVPRLTARLLSDFIHAVEDGRWQGDQSTWVADEDADAEQVLHPIPGDPLRWVALPSALQGKPAQIWTRRNRPAPEVKAAPVVTVSAAPAAKAVESAAPVKKPAARGPKKPVNS